jgi:hypothetical protein
MKFMRTALLAAAFSFILAACGQDAEERTETGSIENDLLAYVPSDSPYLVANLQATPVEILDAYLAMAQPVLDTLQNNLSKMRSSIDTQPTEEHHTRLALAVLEELDGKLSREGLAGLGIDINSNKVVYGMEVFPVFRIGLSDPSALRALIDRVQQKAGVVTTELDHQGVKYWRLTDETSGDLPAGVYVAILENHLAMSVFPLMLEDELLPALLGLELPSDSDASAKLAGLNQKHGYTPYGTGILEVQELTEFFLNPGSMIGRVMAASGESTIDNLGPECTGEIRGLVSHMPRMVAGTTDLTVKSIAYQYRLETDASLAGELAQLVAEIPAVESVSERLFELSFGMRLGRVRDFLRAKAQSVIDSPFQCEHFQELNTGASEAMTQLDQPMPPLVNNFQGLRLAMSELVMSSAMPEKVSGLLAIHVDKPEMFVGMAQMFLPNLSELQLTPGGEPVALPADLVPMPETVSFAAMSDSAIGLSVGAGEESGLQPFLGQEAGPEGTFLSVNYDISAYMEYTNRFQDYDTDAGFPDTGDEAGDQHAQAALDLAKAMEEAFSAVADRSHSSFRFRPDGLVIDGAMTFK